MKNSCRGIPLEGLTHHPIAQQKSAKNLISWLENADGKTPKVVNLFPSHTFATDISYPCETLTIVGSDSFYRVFRIFLIIVFAILKHFIIFWLQMYPEKSTQPEFVKYDKFTTYGLKYHWFEFSNSLSIDWTSSQSSKTDHQFHQHVFYRLFKASLPDVDVLKIL